MIDYQIQAHSRRCAQTGRELRPGDKFYSVLLEEGGRLIRKDFAGDAWQGPPEGAFSFWAGRVPPEEDRNRLRIDDDLLYECFLRLESDSSTGKVNFRFVVALLLMRRKRLKFEEARMEGGQEILSLRCHRTRTLHEVVHPPLTEEEIASVQHDVIQMLGWE